MQAADLERLTRGLDEATLSRRPAAGQWSLKELLSHLWAVQLLFMERTEKMLCEDRPSFASYHPEEDANPHLMEVRPAAEILEDFLEERGRFLDTLEHLEPADWNRAAQHPDFGNYDIHFLAEYLLYYEAQHLFQVVRQRGAAKLSPA